MIPGPGAELPMRPLGQLGVKVRGKTFVEGLMSEVHVRTLTPPDGPLYRALRLSALLESPAAFASSHEEESPRPPEHFAERLAGADQSRVLGAFLGAARGERAARGQGQERFGVLDHGDRGLDPVLASPEELG